MNFDVFYVNMVCRLRRRAIHRRAAEQRDIQHFRAIAKLPEDPSIKYITRRRPLPFKRPFCDRCRHDHDPEFICEMDCITCAIEAEEEGEWT